MGQPSERSAAGQRSVAAERIDGVVVTGDGATITIVVGSAEADVADKQAAAESFRRAADAGDAFAMGRLGSLLAETGRLEESEQWFRRAIACGDGAGAMDRLGIVLAETGRVGEAEQWFRRAIARGDGAGTAGTMGRLGSLLAEAGRLEEAEQWFRRAIGNDERLQT